MTILPISCPAPAPRETLYSYLARLAAVWRTDARGLAYDMGVPIKPLLDQEEKAFENLADWVKVTPDVMEELLSWTGVRAGNVRMNFRGELFVSRALRNPVMRGCPVCLREDAARANGPPSSVMVMRGDWQFREVTLCVHHRHPLVPLWKTALLRDRFDIGARLLEIQAEILAGSFDQPRLEPSSFDFWLDRRLEDGSDHTWFKDIPVSVVAPFCRMLGEAITKGRASGTAHAVGFSVAVQGEAAIRQTLDQIAKTAKKATDEPSQTFWPLYKKLSRDYLDEPGFDPFRDILRECVLDNWARAPGDIILGKIVPERRLHSLSSAESETGIGANVLEHFLIEAGALKADDNLSQSRRLFDAKEYAELLAEIPILVGPIAMRKAMGATKQELVALANEGLLIPRTRVEKVKNPWRISDGVSLVTELSASAILVDEHNNGWETLLLACRRSGLALAELVKSIKDKQLTVGKRAEIDGFHGIVVSKPEVDLMAVPHRAARVKVLDQVPGRIAAAEFGRSIGLRNGGVFLALIQAGHVSAKLIPNQQTGRSQYRMTPKDMAALHERFVTLTTLSSETGQHRNHLRGVVASANITPFSPGGKDFGPVYLRQDVAGLTARADFLQ